MDNLAGKSYKSLRTGQVVKVKDSFENIAILEGNQKMETRQLLDPSQYIEHIDPKSFFDNPNTFNIFAEKIKNIDLSKVEDDSGSSRAIYENTEFPSPNDSTIIGYEDPENEKLELMRKYKNLGFDSSAIEKQQAAISGILDPPVKPFTPPTHQEIQEVSPQQIVNEEVIRVKADRNSDNPIIQMFKNVKRTVDLNIEFEVNNKIPRTDFIEMMEDSYEISIIDYLAEEFTQQILENPDLIKEKIISEIKKIVYPNGQSVPEVKVEAPKKRAPKKAKVE